MVSFSFSFPALRNLHCVWRVWHNCAESSFMCLCASSWSVEERLGEVCLRGRQGFRPHGHGLRHVSRALRFFFGCVLDGAAVKRLRVPQPLGIFARKGALSLLAVHVLEQRPPWPRGQHCPLSLT